MKTNAMRILESLSISYTVHTYEWDEEHLDALHASEAAGLDKECVYKTIVMMNSDKELFVFCLPAEFSVSLKKARAVTNSKDIDLLPLSELQKYTGYIRGGCSPLGMKKHYPTFISELAELEETIYVSAGQRGMQLSLKPDDLLKATNGTYADFI
ncbi:MAG: Cys-tRNA(Pro) deacylase [Spirochaetes bacterium]|uniref:Cys-tRNA(Pro)/Cys-tRNA(Cys) deacylase n=1 Tax=Candidatus Ornithospirochaeta stercoripullorum TaxID=2840899 RepID=A0A9D9E118_9SPIO|nr:Cys-tRNA(Pro) deacylase [Candidatus Ornithospirochaeta stercoripullorum]